MLCQASSTLPSPKAVVPVSAAQVLLHDLSFINHLRAWTSRGPLHVGCGCAATLCIRSMSCPASEHLKWSAGGRAGVPSPPETSATSHGGGGNEVAALAPSANGQETVAVICNGLRGIFVIEQQVVVCNCRSCVAKVRP